MSWMFMEGREIKHIGFYSGLIQTMGYDPQCAILEIRLMGGGKVRRYCDVPEEIWYHIRESCHPDTYYRRHVCGRYAEFMVSDEMIMGDLP